MFVPYLAFWRRLGMQLRNKNFWAVILGGSSGFGLATAKKISAEGMNVCIVHRDRKGSMQKIEEEFAAIRENGVSLLTVNDDALSPTVRQEVVSRITAEIGTGKIRLLMHSIAFGNLKLAAPQQTGSGPVPAALLAEKLGIAAADVGKAANELFAAGHDAFCNIADAAVYNNENFLGDEDLEITVFAMGTSLLSWVQALHTNGLFAVDARVVGLTSEGNEIAWRGYAAVSAAKTALEAVARSIALEFAPYGIRCNIVQPGVTDTPALRMIPGSRHLSARARLRNPFGRLTTPRDVANLIYLLCTDEAAWINGALIRCDGGEHIAG
jgi:NAD(P)-dependent dehydrogenase (short-subunit alcohol dehydrogenase family)